MADYLYKLEECMTCPMHLNCLAMGPGVPHNNSRQRIGDLWQRKCCRCDKYALIRVMPGYHYLRHTVAKPVSCCPVMSSSMYECPDCHREEIQNAVEDTIRYSITNGLTRSDLESSWFTK